MKIIRQSTQYKKDFKRYRNQPKKLEKLLGVLRLLANDEELPAELKAHKLIGEYNDCMECLSTFTSKEPASHPSS